MLSVYEITKKSETKAITRVNIRRNQKLYQKNLGGKKQGNKQLEEQCSQDAQWQWQKHSCRVYFSSHFSLLSF